MAVQFPPGSFTPEKPFTDTAGVRWVVWRDGVVGGAWKAAPLSAGNPYNYRAFDASTEVAAQSASSARGVLDAINKRAVKRIAAQANERTDNGGGGVVILVILALLALSKGR